jgi:hypothetical protein
MFSRFLLFFCFSLNVSLCAAAASQTPANWISFYQQRYPLKNDTTKLVDNYGRGYEDLYGTRNFRVVLNGVMYRGGANNDFNRNGKRANHNPLPNEGLKNLCEEGFSQSVYLYTTNFKTAPPVTNCKSARNEQWSLKYTQLSPYKDAEIRKMLELVYNTIFDSSKGPVYMHCWNGWHASGMISAMALRQFCGITSAQALQYWTRNTDGHYTNPAYADEKELVRKFQPYPDLKISSQLQQELCPKF